MLLESRRCTVIEYCRKMFDAKLTSGTWGNISLRDPESKLIALTPSGMKYSQLDPQDIVVVDADGRVIDGHRRATIETEMHLRILEKNPKCHGVVHTHSFYATVLSIIQREIPPITAEFGLIGHKISVAPFALPGSKELSICVADYLKDRRAVLLANHGVATVGKDLESAYQYAMVVEETAHLYWSALAVAPDQISILPDHTVQELNEFFKTRYGQK